MHNGNVLERFFLSNPHYRGMAEMAILIGTGIGGQVLGWKRLAAASCWSVFGWILIGLALGLHFWSERDHKQAHEKSGDIEKIVSSGVYAKIRHPLYLTLIMGNIGIALAFNILATLILSLLSIGHWVGTALAEETALAQSFPAEYEQYRHKVRWRMIPGIF